MNNDIFPCLWFDKDAKEAADFYNTIFGGKIITNTPIVVDIEIFGQKLMLLNGGPHFSINPSISFTIICEDEAELQNYWDSLANEGMILMELDAYPWSKKYGWIKDKWGTTWQLYLGQSVQNLQRLVPTLMFINENNGKAKEAMDFYTQTFPNSKIEGILLYKDGGEDNNEPKENVQHANFEIDHYSMFCLDSSHQHQFNFTEGVSLVKMTNNQTETDYLWNSLISDGGQESMCGWLKDKYGVSWQIVPKRLIELMYNPNQETSQKAMQAMLKMQKINIEELEKAVQS